MAREDIPRLLTQKQKFTPLRRRGAMNEELNLMKDKSIVLIDGVCHLCQG